MTFCSQCGSENPKGTKYCSRCGSKFAVSTEPIPPIQPQAPPAETYTTGPSPPYQPSYDRPPKDRMVAGILALLLGGLGIHKFYLDNPGAGMLYLCFCWTGIPEIIGFIEGIIYLTESDEEFQREHVNQPI